MIAVYIQNRSPQKKFDDKTLAGAFFGKNPSVDHLLIFGCLVYIHIPKDKIKKLEPTSMKCIFVSYSTSSKSYRVYIKE